MLISRYGNIRNLPDAQSARFTLLRNIVFQYEKGFGFGTIRIQKGSDSDSIKISGKILFTGFESGFGKVF